MERHFCSKLYSVLLLQNHRQNSFRVLASLFSTKNLVQPHAHSPPTESLYDRIKRVRNPRISILPAVQQWVNQQGTIDQQELRDSVRMLMDSRRYVHALQVSEWMTDCCYFLFSPSDIAIRLDLICRVRGLEHAENFFNMVPYNLKTSLVYGALLRCYVQENVTKEAEDILEKMKHMGMIQSSFPYNWLITLYARYGLCDKIEKLVQEMEGKGFHQDSHTLTNWMAAFVRASDISGMEKILDKIENIPNFVVGWNLYAAAAFGYQKAGLIEKALEMMRKMEEEMPPRRRPALGFLLSLYANIGDKFELLRVWRTYKPADEEMNELYCIMITSLAKLDDLKGAERIFEEWESRCIVYDFRVLNRLLVAYSRNGLLEKAESVATRAAQGRTPYASTWNVLAMGYMERNDMAKAVEMLKRAMSVARLGWRPSPAALTACLNYLEEKGDPEDMEEMIRLFKKSGPSTRDVYHRWLRSCVKAGKPVSEALDQMKMDGFEIDKETELILDYSLSS